jgi:intracellular sulfur oxidation DsrE/DsrF family protein
MHSVRVVFHVDEAAKWGLVLKNVDNLLLEIDRQTSQVEVVANGEAVEFYQTPAPEHTELPGRLAGAGVLFTACRNALRDRGIPEGGLWPFVQIVPAGVLELALRQKEGYAYIKP